MQAGSFKPLSPAEAQMPCRQWESVLGYNPLSWQGLIHLIMIRRGNADAGIEFGEARSDNIKPRLGSKFSQL